MCDQALCSKAEVTSPHLVVRSDLSFRTERLAEAEFERQALKLKEIVSDLESVSARKGPAFFIFGAKWMEERMCLVR